MLNKNVSQPVNGMNRDAHPMRLDDQSYSYALNAHVEGFDGNGFPILQNDVSNILCTNFPTGYKPIGYTHIVEQERVIWYLTNSSTGASMLAETLRPGNCKKETSTNTITGACDDCGAVITTEPIPLEKTTQSACCDFHQLANDECLGFNINYPIISSEYRIKDCEIELFFTDGKSWRYIIFEYENDNIGDHLKIKQKFYKVIGYEDAPCEVPIYSTELDCNKLNVQPDSAVLCVEFLDLVSGGANRAGSYQFFVSYADELGNRLTPIVSSTNIIPIKTRDITFETNYVTDRAIKLKVHNLDPTGPYAYYNLIVAKTIDAFTSFYLAGTYPVTQSVVTYTGNNESEPKLSENDIFQRPPYYASASDVTVSGNLIFWSGMKEYPKINIQRIANNVILYWQTTAIPEAVYRNPINVNKFRGCMRDEVYPYGLVLIWENGEETAVGHIPGRVAKATDLEIISNNDVIQDNSCVTDTRNLRWQNYNTATILGGNLEIYQECKETCWQYGEFAYWESTDTYPNLPEIYGDLCGMPIRHHKYPDSVISHIHNYENGSATFNDNNLVFPIGVKVDHDSVRAAIAQAVVEGVITQEDADRIKGYRIVRGNRYNNKSVLAKGLLYDMNQYQRKDGDTLIDQQPIYFANYPYNDLRENAFITDQFDNYDDHNTEQGANLPFTFSKRYTFHSPDTHFREETVGTELKLETVEYGQSEGYYMTSNKQPKQKLLSNSSYYLAMTGGIVAALLRTEEKDCVEYTVKSQYKYEQADSTVSQASFNTGQSITGTTTGIWAGFVEGELTGTINTVNAGGSIGQHTISNPDITQTNSQLSGENKGYDENTGNVGNLKDVQGNDVTVETWSRRVCKGTRQQYFENPGLNDNAMSSVLGILTTIVSKTVDFIRVVLEEMNIILDLIKSLTPFRDWSVQYHSVGKYNNYTTVANDTGNKRRKIDSWAYLKSENSLVDESITSTITGAATSIRINNWNRESSLYLKYDGADFPNAGVASGHVDQSRVTLTSADCTLNKRIYSPISSYYASIKNYVPDQYGTIYDIEYLLTDSCTFDINQSNDECKGVYGGDTFINRFALKIKVPYFLATPYLLPEGVDWNYSMYTNLAYPRHYFNNTNKLGSEIDNILDLLNPINILNPNIFFDNLGRPKSIRDCATDKFFYQNGYIYLYHYGIPYFLVESDINVDMRHGENDREKDFYPHQQNLDTWLQQDYVPISEDNTYFYNNAYSKQNKESFFLINPPDFNPSRDCKVEHPNRIIYADGANWLVYKANNFTDIPLNKGRLTSIEGIENDMVLVRTENTTLKFPSILRTVVDGQTVQVGTGGVFVNPPQEFASTTLGYIGTQHKAILHTEYGHIWADAKRGQVFNVEPGGGGVDEISKNGMKDWFKENLPFRILRDFSNLPESDIDNGFKGLGLILSFDKRYNRFFITKRDYKKKNNNVLYDSETKEFYIMNGTTRTNISLFNRLYFTDCSWTVSYNFFTKSWVSHHSFKPNYYIDFMDFIASGIDEGLWLHNATNNSYQVYYGKLYPFIVENIQKFEIPLKSYTSCEFDTEVRQYTSEYDYVVRKEQPGFNKAIISNDHYSTGLLNLIKINKNDLSIVGKYPVKNMNSWDIQLSPANYKWRFNQFKNLIKPGSSVPLWLYNANNADKQLNPIAFNYQPNEFNTSTVKGQWFRITMINDNLSNYKIIHKFALNNQTPLFK